MLSCPACPLCVVSSDAREPVICLPILHVSQRLLQALGVEGGQWKPEDVNSLTRSRNHQVDTALCPTNPCEEKPLGAPLPPPPPSEVTSSSQDLGEAACWRSRSVCEVVSSGRSCCRTEQAGASDLAVDVPRRDDRPALLIHLSQDLCDRFGLT
ncbi:hypothetical protein FQA47_022219 [Oryzias melastigma]|uniref:Uncharacterized protein n=1 Tax=Oryzias melastigma TaxID=30732 RepID=A0A834L0K5_ORYME|nr:hypothetical protein FQA47_022219 [Oryzias melastigma]